VALRTWALLSAFALFLVPASPASADPSADQIFEHAKRVLQAQAYPDPIFYRTTIAVREGDKDEIERFHAEAFSGEEVRVEGISDEEQAAPHQSSGVNFKLSFSLGWNTGAGGQTETVTKDAHRNEALPDYLGIPLISPRYSFGLSSEHAENSTAHPVDADSLPTIATVTATDRAYDVSLIGTESIDGSFTYHLRLQPVSRPNRYRIRDLWIDVYTYQIVRLQAQGNFTVSPMSDVPWVVTFQDVGGISYIRDETALEPLVFHHDRTFSTARIAFDDIRTADAGPSILPAFDGDGTGNLREPARGLRAVTR
jgi:hypothetical protein